MEARWDIVYVCYTKEKGGKKCFDTVRDIAHARFNDAVAFGQEKLEKEFARVEFDKKDKTVMKLRLNDPNKEYRFKATIKALSNYGWIVFDAQVSAEEEKEAKKFLKAFLKEQGFRFIFLSHTSFFFPRSGEYRSEEVASSVQERTPIRGHCSTCIHCIREWPYLYCSEITEKRFGLFGEEVMKRVDRNGTCDHFIAKKTSDNSNYRRG